MCCKHYENWLRWPDGWFQCCSLSSDDIWMRIFASESPDPDQSIRRQHGLRSNSLQSHLCLGRCEWLSSDILMMIHGALQIVPYFLNPKWALYDPTWPQPIFHQCNSSNRLCHCFVRMCRRIPSLVYPKVLRFYPSCQSECHSLSLPFPHTWWHRCVFQL